MFPAARIMDPITHDMLVPCGLIGPQAPAPCPMCAAAPVLIEGMPAAHVMCTTICSGAISAGLVHPPLPPPPLPILKGSVSVFIHGMPAVRWSPAPDIGTCGVFFGDPKLAALRTVFIGDVGTGSTVSPDGSAAAGAGGGGGGGGGAAGGPETQRYATAEEAAIAAMQAYNPTSGRENREYGGWIRRNADGTFTPQPAVRGTIDGLSNIPDPGPNDVAWWHTHGATTPGYDSENFSGADGDMGYSNAHNRPGYLATPSGVIRRYDPATGAVTTLPQTAPQ